jgi:hypothetical protein
MFAVQKPIMSRCGSKEAVEEIATDEDEGQCIMFLESFYSIL